jgi:hypothetical protein
MNRNRWGLDPDTPRRKEEAVNSFVFAPEVVVVRPDEQLILR